MAVYQSNSNSSNSNNINFDKITIEEFRNLYIQNLKGSFYKNDAVKKSYFIEGTVCSEIERQKHGASFKIQSDEGNLLNVYVPKRAGLQSSLELGNKITLYGLFNIYENNIANQLDFIEFKASRILDSTTSESKKEAILFSLNEMGFLDKPKKELSFDNKDFLKLMVVSSKDGSASAEIANCLKNTDFFEVSMHYIDTYKSSDMVEMFQTLDKNNYYDAILITGIDSSQKRLFEEIDVLEAIIECSTPIITAMGRCIADEVADIVEEGPLSAARMLLYQYKESKFEQQESSKVMNEHNSNLFITLNKEKEDLEHKISLMFNDKVSLSSKIKNQQRIILLLSAFSFIFLLILILK
ncbi:MAG: hypothetical protein Q8942_09915 [Bacillota bacterium]|nr:hypothetical protein [Bacillota bacterium]